jgi:hypothetical protein
MVLMVILVGSYVIMAVWVGLVTIGQEPAWLSPEAETHTELMTSATFGQATRSQQADLSILIELYYNKSLVVNEPVRIKARAVLQSVEAKSRTVEVRVSFQNALAWPKSYDENGLLSFGQVSMMRQDNATVLNNESVLFWTVEGQFHPIIVTVFAGGIGYEGVTQDIAIQVFPHEKLMESQANRVTLVLTYALFVLTALGIVTTVFELWDRITPQSAAVGNPNCTHCKYYAAQSEQTKVTAEHHINQPHKQQD